MLNSINHLKAEADHRREVLSRKIPLHTPEIFYLEAKERRMGSVAGWRPPLLTKFLQALGRLVEPAVQGTNSRGGVMRKSAVALMAMLMMLLAVSAQADAPEVLELNLIHIRGDLEHEIVVFWNITRDDLCGWIEGGFVGPRPIEALLPVFFQETGNGAVVAKSRAERVMEVWHFANKEALDPCSATAGQLGPLATGRGLFVFTDNDFDVSGTRLNAFGATLQARLTGADRSTWHYRWVFRGFIDLAGEFSEIVNFRMFQVGN